LGPIPNPQSPIPNPQSPIPNPLLSLFFKFIQKKNIIMTLRILIKIYERK